MRCSNVCDRDTVACDSDTAMCDRDTGIYVIYGMIMRCSDM